MRTVLFRAILSLLLVCPLSGAEEHFESFDEDPGWDGMNNRSTDFDPREIKQDFGYSPGKGIGGTIMPDGRPAYYATPIATKTLDDAFHASGSVEVKKGAGNELLGFFNSNTINEWRTPNSIVFRINGRGENFHVHIEFCSSKWRASAGVIGRYDKEADRMYPVEIPGDSVHTWSLRYDPSGANGMGNVIATFDDYTASFDLSQNLRMDGAAFDRFGLLNVNKSADSPGELWIPSVELMGERIDLSTDPGWEELNNRSVYITEEVRPRFNFGYSETQHAGGAGPGEIGGLFYRGDCREAARLAYYGAKLDTLSLDKPVNASGKVVLRRGVTDSSVLFGFFHSEHSVKVNPSQSHGLPMNFLGVSIEGPSSEGFWVYPGYRMHGDAENTGRADTMPYIYPDGVAHDWSIEYTPPTDGNDAAIKLTFDGQIVSLPVPPQDLATGAQFDRFGFVTPWIDGNAQRVYLDDITYTTKQ